MVVVVAEAVVVSVMRVVWQILRATQGLFFFFYFLYLVTTYPCIGAVEVFKEDYFPLVTHAASEVALHGFAAVEEGD